VMLGASPYLLKSIRLFSLVLVVTSRHEENCYALGVSVGAGGMKEAMRKPTYSAAD
jgi:hypothetical protein